MNIEEIRNNGLESLGLFYSVYAGVVVKNDDPEKAARLQVKVPAILGDTVIEEWAIPIGVPNGSKSGFISLPKVGQQVWVQFANGNLEFPLWQYGAFKLKEVPEEMTDQKTILVSPNGNSITVDDADDSIKLEQKDGFSVKVTDQGIFLGKSEVNLKSFFTELLEFMKTATIPTAIGPQTYTPSSLLELETIKDKIENFLI